MVASRWPQRLDLRAAFIRRSTSCPVRYFRPTREKTVVGVVFWSIGLAFVFGLLTVITHEEISFSSGVARSKKEAQRRISRRVKSRAKTSDGPLVGNGTMKRTGRDG